MVLCSAVHERHAQMNGASDDMVVVQGATSPKTRAPDAQRVAVSSKLHTCSCCGADQNLRLDQWREEITIKNLE